jgi:hypothetical protein
MEYNGKTVSFRRSHLRSNEAGETEVMFPGGEWYSWEASLATVSSETGQAYLSIPVPMAYDAAWNGAARRAAMERTAEHLGANDVIIHVIAMAVPFGLRSGPRSTPRRVPAAYQIVSYAEKAAGFENHHGVLDAWGAANIVGYRSRAPGGPTIRLTRDQHTATKEVYTAWRRENSHLVANRKVDWTKVSPQEAQSLAERMFDAAGVPAATRAAYYSDFNKYIHTGRW